MKLLNIIAVLLVFLGGLNWTLIGLLDVNLFTTIFGTTGITTLVYLLVTISTVHLVIPKMMEHFQTS